MKIKTRLLLSTACSVGAALVIGLILFVTAQQVKEAIERNKIADEVTKAASDLNIIAYEYLIHHEARPQAQWESRHKSIEKLLTGQETKGTEEQAVLQRILQNQESIGSDKKPKGRRNKLFCKGYFRIRKVLGPSFPNWLQTMKAAGKVNQILLCLGNWRSGWQARC